MIPKIYRTTNNKVSITTHYPQPNSKSFNNSIEDIKEMFHDEVFGDESNLNRSDFLIQLSQNVTWIFNSEALRKKWAILCE